MPRRRPIRPWVAVLLLLSLVLPAAGGRAAAAEAPRDEPVTVLVGVGGLRWSDIDRSRTPTLWRMTSDAAAGSLSVRTGAPRTCPLDAWLTVSAGRRAVGLDPAAACTPVPAVRENGSVENWRALVRLQEQETGVDDRPGLLGDRLRGSGTCATAVGPGAALGLADPSGRVARYSATVDDAGLADCPVGVVDGGDLLSPSEPSSTTLPRFDRMVEEITGEVPPGSRIIVAGLADHRSNPPGLQVVLRLEVGARTPTWLTSGSTQRTGIVQLTDLTATLLEVAGSGPEGTDGRPIRLDASRRSGTAGTIDNREDLARLGSVVPAIVPWFGGLLVGGQLLAYGAGALARRRARLAGRHSRWRAAVYAVGLAAACAPVATYLSSLTDWWTSSVPALTLAAWGVGLTGIVAVAAHIAGRGRPWGVVAAVAGVTMAVLTVDGILGTPLQYGSLLVAGPAVSGRFYGFNNATFAVYATSALLLAGAAAAALLARGRRALAVAAVLGIGTVAVAVDGWPAFGADFGGVLALVPGIAVLAFAVSGHRVTATRVLAAAVVAVAVVSAIAVGDWLRPPAARTHLGEFVARLVEGDAGGIVVRKAQASLSTLLFPVAGPFVVAASTLAVVAVWRPDRLRPSGLARTYERVTLLRPTLASIVVTAVIGCFANDTGIVIPGMALLLTVPLVVAVSVRLGHPDLSEVPPRHPGAPC